jgi:uncharacterized protein (DUF1330 family)
MPAYWIAHAKINDPVEYKKYTDPLPDIFKKHGATILARGGRFQVMEGPEYFARHVVIEFPTFEQAVACFESEEYRAAAAHRRQNGVGEVQNVIVEGGDATHR